MRCLICGRELKDEESIKRHIGPTCWARIQQIAREQAEAKKKKKEIKGQINMFEEEK